MILGSKSVSPLLPQKKMEFPEILTQKPMGRNSLVLCERETDIIDDEEEGADSPTESGTGHREKFIPMEDDPLLSEDILSCISALDDVIAEFDEPSLPYICENEGVNSGNEVVPSVEAVNKLVESPLKNRRDKEMQHVSEGSKSSSQNQQLNQIPPSSTNQVVLQEKGVTVSPSKLGGTYSKGTSLEQIYLPRIPSSCDKSSNSSSRSKEEGGMHQGKSRPHLSPGVFGVPPEPEIDYEEAEESHGHLSTQGSGRFSQASSGKAPAGLVAQMTKEFWNFPTEKNLPRSLRKTRKTCMLEGGNEEGITDDASSIASDGHSSSIKEEEKLQHKAPNNQRGKNDRMKIYEKISRPNQVTEKVDAFLPESPTTSSSASFSFNSSNSSGIVCNSSVPLPKPRARQQIPKAEEISVVKYPPGKITKPNPKPTSGNLVKVNNGTSSTENTNGNNGNVNNGHKETGNKSSNSTGSGSNISRSSSSSSGGDSSHKDNLSTSSGIVLTASSSTTTTSPSHSINNNNDSLPLKTKNNVTIISTERMDGGAVVMRGNKSGNRQIHPQHLIAAKPAVVLTGNGVLEVDDGYLSMINRNEAPLLWPEEFIENETFSPDELKRLSVLLPEEDEDAIPSGLSSGSSEKELELEIVDYEREPSRRRPVPVKSEGWKDSKGRRNPQEYFSDDSLEGDREEEVIQRRKNRGPHQNSGGQFHNPTPYYRQQITVNTALIQPSNISRNSNVSRIPKMVGKKSPVEKQIVETPKRKPCSFFVSLTEDGNVTPISEVTPKAPSPTKVTVKCPEVKSPQISTKTQEKTSQNNKVTGSSLPLPQAKLRHTKSINTGGPRNSKSSSSPSSISNAIKRKSASDLVTVVSLNTSDESLPLPNITSTFNRTSTFLIPSSPSCRTEEETVTVTGQKRPRDDDTDDDDYDISSDFDLSNAAEPVDNYNSLDIGNDNEQEPEDSLQPLSLSLTEVHDFVSEIMDTALRQEVQETQKALNDYQPLENKDTADKNEPQKNLTNPIINNDEQIPSAPPCDNIDDERTRVSQQLDAVVTNFISENKSFLIRGESVEDEVERESSSGSANADSKENVEDVKDPQISTAELEKEEQLEEIVLDDTVEIPLEPDTRTESTGTGLLKDSSLLGEDKFLDEKDSEEESEAGSEEIPPAFIPSPPPKVVVVAPVKTPSPPSPLSNFHQAYQLHASKDQNVREGKAMLDLLAERIQKNRNSEDQVAQVSQFVHDRREIWKYYDRPFDEDLMLPARNGRRYATRSQENLLESITREKVHRSFSGRHGQSSTLPLNCRPPQQQRRTSTFRNMFKKFRKNKNSAVITELNDVEVQSITSRETGASEQGKKRGFFSRLFRRSRKN